jgi:hypothetical protein
MSRLDRHVSFVQGKLALGQFLYALAFTITIWLAAVWLALVIDRVLNLALPHPSAFFWAGAVMAAVAAFIYSVVKKPSAHDAAVAIDRTLGLNEKFSTALFVRSSDEPFAQAAVRDAEQTADNVSLHKRFPMSFPKTGYWTGAVAAVVLLTLWLLPDLNLFARSTDQQARTQDQKKRDEAKKTIEKALATVNSYPKSLQSDQAIQMAKKDLEGLLNKPVDDPDRATRTAFKALEQSNDAVKEEIRKNSQYAMAKSNEKMLKSLNPPTDAEGPVADAQRDLAKGDFTKAIDNLNQVAEKFDKMSDAEQKKAAQQMAQMAQQLQQMAQNPAQQQQLQKQMQQMGASQQQAQQLAKQMQQAAQGNQQAQQQLQQLQQQMMKQAQAQGKGSQMQQMMKQMQTQSSSQATAQQMAQAAQQMAQAMQQGASQKGTQQAGAQQGSMSQAKQQMQQAMGQMDAVQKDADQMAAAQNSTQSAADDAANQAGDNSGNSKNGKNPGASDKTGKWAAGDTNKDGNGAGGPGRGNGGHIGVEQAPYAIKKEADPVQNIDNGKILASTFVKAGTVKGESKVALSKAAESALKDSTDEVDEESVSKESQKVVKDYFETMQKDQ